MILGWSLVYTHLHTHNYTLPISLFLGRSERSRGCFCCQVGGWHSWWRRETRRAPIISRTGKEISTSLYLMLRERTLARLGKKGERKRDLPFLRTRGENFRRGDSAVSLLFRFFSRRLTLLLRFHNFYRHCDIAKIRGMFTRSSLFRDISPDSNAFI